jgi:hypothetical protein
VAMSVPGVPPLTFGCPHIESSGRRVSWSGSVLTVNEPSAYILSAADWLTLVEVLGLATDLNDAARKG